MRQDRRLGVALLLGVLSVGALAATGQLLDAADLALPSRPALQPQQQSQPGPTQQEQAVTEPNSPQAEPRAAAEPASRPADSAQPPAAQPDSSPPDRPAAIVLERREARSILGREVRSAAGENMGRIIDVIVDQAGNARAAVIDFGGFLGVGSRKIAVAWNSLHFAVADGSDRITLGFTKDQVKAAPEYQEGKPIVVMGASGATDRFRVTTSVK
ncbi:MAG: PRC-barrel domain-containing protein [Xanthobacteraceae bacterium]|nr:PRC-barrel domain-containing protein [Xanthobacteraceae bacterium]